MGFLRRLLKFNRLPRYFCTCDDKFTSCDPFKHRSCDHSLQHINYSLKLSYFESVCQKYDDEDKKTQREQMKYQKNIV